MNKTFEGIKTVIIAFLVFFMLFLWAKNMQLYFPRTNSENSAVLDSEFWIFNESTEAHTEIMADSSYFSPTSITLVSNGKSYTSATNEKLTSILWDNYKSLVKEVFSSSYVCSLASVAELENALAYDDFILIDFPSDLPYITVCALENKTSGFAEGELCSVKTLLLYSDADNTVSAVSTDRNGNVYSFSPQDSSLIYDFNSNNLTAYTVNKGFLSSTIAINEKNETASILPVHHVILTEAPSLSQLEIANPISELFDSEYSDNITNLALISNPTIISLLEAFNINPSTAGVYTDAAARLIFINSDARLVIDRNGSLDYAVSRESDAQILTSALLESERSQFSSFEQITAATRFLNLFKGTFIGNDARLLLSSINYNSGKTEYVFKYHKNLCEISSESFDPAVQLVFDGAGLVEARIVPLIVKESHTIQSADNLLTTDIPETTALVLSSINQESFQDFRPIYFCTTNDTTAIPVWASIAGRE